MKRSMRAPAAAGPIAADIAAPAATGISPIADAHNGAAHAKCSNCDANVSGRYCSACGQKVEVHSHSLWSFVTQFAEVLTHGDSRLWRTLGQLISHPGFLTQQFLIGRRASYLPPFQLYIVLSVVFFMVFSFSGPLPTKSLETAAGAVAGRLDARGGTASTEELCRSSVSPLPGPEWIRRPFLTACLRTNADQSRELGRDFIHNLGRAMFVFLPLLAAFMTCLYRRPKRYYVDHLLLLVHNQAFLFLLMSVYLIATHWLRANAWTWGLAAALIGYALYYMARSLRTVYAQSALLTAAKFTALAAGYAICATCMVLLTGIYTAQII